jgi:hypothetical protein
LPFYNFLFLGATPTILSFSILYHIILSPYYDTVTACLYAKLPIIDGELIVTDPNFVGTVLNVKQNNVGD